MVVVHTALRYHLRGEVEEEEERNSELVRPFVQLFLSLQPSAVNPQPAVETTLSFLPLEQVYGHRNSTRPSHNCNNLAFDYYFLSYKVVTRYG